jgi:hypothetical protein
MKIQQLLELELARVTAVLEDLPPHWYNFIHHKPHMT